MKPKSAETPEERHSRLDELVDRRQRERSSTPPATPMAAEFDFSEDEITEVRDLALKKTREQHDECMRRSRQGLERIEAVLDKLGV